MDTNHEPQRPASQPQTQSQSQSPQSGRPQPARFAPAPAPAPAPVPPVPVPPVYQMPPVMPTPPQDPMQVMRGRLRRMVTRPVGLTLVYELVMNGVAIVTALAITVTMMAGRSGRIDIRIGLGDLVNRYAGVVSLIGVLCAFVFLLAMRRRDILTREFWLGGPHVDSYGEPWQRGRASRYGGAHMRPLWFLVFIALCLGVQGAVTLVQLGFSAVGLSLPSPTSESISESAVTVSMWLYIGLVGPICEEVLFRGVLMKELKPLGRNFAIVTSALLFGLFHEDVVQGVFAFLLGLLLGFVAMEYSLVWAIALHVFNNAILGGVVDGLASHYLGETGYMVYAVALGVVGVAAMALVLVRYGGGLRDYARVNRSAPGTYVGWTSWAFIVFVALNGLSAIDSFVGALMG